MGAWEERCKMEMLAEISASFSIISSLKESSSWVTLLLMAWVLSALVLFPAVTSAGSIFAKTEGPARKKASSKASRTYVVIVKD